MKKLIPLFLVILLAAIGCKDKCQDSFCPSGYTCVDGVCTSANGCPIGYEGDDCNIESSAKFKGNYNTTYTGSGGLAGSDGTTIAKVTLVGGMPNKIRIDVDLDVNANIFGQALNLPLTVSIEGDVDGETYTVPSTTITSVVDLQGFPLPINLTFEVEGTKISDSQLNSTLTMTGLLSGTIEMEGVK